jgi:hypothetical protein
MALSLGVRALKAQQALQVLATQVLVLVWVAQQVQPTVMVGLTMQMNVLTYKQAAGRIMDTLGMMALVAELEVLEVLAVLAVLVTTTNKLALTYQLYLKP